MALAFSKMHGIGNDFVVLDCRQHACTLDAAQIRRMGDRHLGVGFDQLLTIEQDETADCAFRYAIWNRDGSPSGQCGNGVRCVAAWLARDGSLDAGLVRLMSPSGPVRVEVLADARVRVDMGEPRFAPADVPFAATTERDRYRIEVAGRTIEIGAVSMGNPHAVQVVADVDRAPVETQGPLIERHVRFPERVNAGFMQILDPAHIRLRVFERGAGETLACGTGACAAVAVGRRLGLLDEAVRVSLPGGDLSIAWAGGAEPIWMTGPAVSVFSGEIEP